MDNKRIYIIGALFLVVAALFSSGYHQFDEHFQINEFAGLKLGLTEQSNLPWEFHRQMRSAIQPAIVVLVHLIFGLFNFNDPFIISTIMRLLSAALSFWAIHLFYSAYKDKIADQILKKWFVLLSFFTWFALYNNVRFSAEHWGGAIFLIAIALFQKKGELQKKDFLITGLLCGLAFIFRFQVGFLVLGFWLWLLIIKKIGFQNIVLVSFGILLSVGFGILVDRWFYGDWTIASFNYLWTFVDYNIITDKSGFGISPWYGYFQGFTQILIPPFSLVFILCPLIVFFFKPRNVLTWIIVPFLVIHCIIPHKEHRFFFPIVGFLPLLIIMAIEIIRERWYKGLPENRYTNLFVKAFWIVNLCLLLLVAFRPADYQIPLYRVVYDDYKEPITLYYRDSNPYFRILDIYYYKRPNLEIIRIDSPDSIIFNQNGKSLFVTNNPGDFENLDLKGRLIYSTFPEWVRHFNFNNWLERTKLWYVYELSK